MKALLVPLSMIFATSVGAAGLEAGIEWDVEEPFLTEETTLGNVHAVQPGVGDYDVHALEWDIEEPFILSTDIYSVQPRIVDSDWDHFLHDDVGYTHN